MATQVDFCNRCAAAIFDEDDVAGGCCCPDGQLKQLLARVRAPKTIETPKKMPTPNPWVIKAAAPQVPVVQDVDLQALWNTDLGEEEIVTAASSGGLESLWMGRVAAEMGERAPHDANLENLWMREIATESGTTAHTADDFSFDDVGFDEELSRYRGAPNRAAAFRVDRPPVARTPGRYEVMAESREVMTRTAAREAAMTSRPQREAPVSAPKPAISAIQKAAEYSNRVTIYQRLM